MNVIENVIQLNDHWRRRQRVQHEHTRLMLDLWLEQREEFRKRGDLANVAEIDLAIARVRAGDSLDRIRADMQRGAFDDEPPKPAA